MNPCCDQMELDAAFCRVCEEVVFALVDPVSLEDLVDEAGPYLAATVSVDGPITGSVSILTSLPTVQELASNLLVDDADEGTGPALLRELANIAAGVLVGLLTDEQGLCSFGVPSDRVCDQGRWQQACAAEGSRGYRCDEGSLLWSWNLHAATGRLQAREVR